MEYIHVKNLEKYHPGYKDRRLQWCKAHFNMLNADPEFEMLTEVDKWRFLTLVMLELQMQQPVPFDETYLKRKGMHDKRPIRLSIKMLHNFIELIQESHNLCGVEIEIETETETEIEKDNIPQIEALLKLFNSTLQTHIKTYWDRARLKNKSKVITDGRRLTMLNELYNTYQRCNDPQLFSYALETAIRYDAPNIGYIDAVIKNRKIQKPR